MNISEVCHLSDEIRPGELMISVFLDQAILNPNSKEANSTFVLRATYLTTPLRSLFEHITQKLIGAHPKGSAIIRGTYGSGKSHALLALYHIVRGRKEAQKTLNKWGIGVRLPERVRVAAVQLRSERPDTLWELLFKRADCGNLNEEVRDYPTREQWASLGRGTPTLLIVDELEQWFEAQNALEQARTKSALANMLEAAELSDVSLAVAIAIYGTNNELMAVINRVHPPIWDVGTAEDRQKIVTHRLIDKIDKVKAKRVVREYIETYDKVRREFPSLSHLADFRKEMEESYPFHPHFLRQAYQVYAAMPRHESTRGVVGVCATLLRKQANQRDMILTGNLDITDEEIASDLRKLDPELVQNATEDIHQRCVDISEGTGIIGTVLLHSFSPYGTPGATEEEILIGNLRTGGNINDLRASLDEIKSQAWFIDEVGERFIITKEVVLIKQIDQMARARFDTGEGREQAAEYIRSLIREAIHSEHLTFYPHEPLPTSTGTIGLKYIISLMPLRDQEALEILKGLDNTVVLLAPKPNVREQITVNRDLLLWALRVLVCEDLLKQKSKRQTEVRNLKSRFDRDLIQLLNNSYARWMRLSRTNELGQTPNFILRPMECGLSAKSVEEKIREQYDVDAMRDGIAKLLSAQGRDKTKGSEQSALTLAQIRQGLRRERGLPILAFPTSENFENAIRRMVQDSGENGIVVQAGRALYGYDEITLPSVLSDDWRIWLKPFSPEPPAKEDVKQRVRQELARTQVKGVIIRDLKSAVTYETGLATEEVVRAIVEMVNDHEAVVEQDETRYPDDGLLSSGSLINDGRAWLTEHAPADDRKARARILTLVKDAGDEGMTWKQVQIHLSAEGTLIAAIQRAVERLMGEVESAVEFYEEKGQQIIREPKLPTDNTVLRIRKEVLPPPQPPSWKVFSLNIQPYRLSTSRDLLMAELRSKVKNESRIKEVIFTVRPVEDTVDPLFGKVRDDTGLAQVHVEHRLTWQFLQTITKEALLNLITHLFEILKEKGEVIIEAIVSGEA